MLANYEYYTKEYLGNNIPSDSFSKYSMDATRRINYYTQHRIEENNISDDIKNACCEIAELLLKQDSLYDATIKKDNEITSETVGPRSVTYANNANLKDKRIMTEDELEIACYKICYKHIAHTGLMYRGVR